MSLLSTRGLSKSFAGLQAVSDVTLDIPPGQIRALIGPNGAGKTTLVGMMAYTFQITSVFARLPVRENVALAVRGDVARADAALDRLGMLHMADQIAGDLAYGHQRLLEIAMGLAQKPKLLILDEPTQGLTDGEIDSFKTLVRSLAPETTILLIEHNMNVVMETAEVVTVLEFGAVLAEGTPEEIRASSAVQAAYLGTG